MAEIQEPEWESSVTAKAAQNKPDGSDAQISFAGQSASGHARQHVGNVYSNTSYAYTVRKRRSDDTLRENERNRVFLTAAAEGQTPRVAYLLRLGVDLDHSDDEGFTALHHACLSGFEDVVQLLLESGADVNAQSLDLGTPLCLAALRERENVVQLLLKYRASVDKAGLWVGSPLHCASFVGSLAVTKILLDHGAALDSVCSIRVKILAYGCTLYSQKAQPPTRPYSDHRHRIIDCQPFHVAVFRGHETLVIQFLKVGQLVDNTYREWTSKNPATESYDSTECGHRCGQCTALTLACSRGNFHLASHILTAGATVDIQDTQGESALHEAARQGYLRGVEMLLQAGASLDSKNNWLSTPLLLAAEYGHEGIVKCLAERGADVDAQDNDWDTPCHVAIKHVIANSTLTGIVRILLANGASLSEGDKHGMTPLQCAIQRNHDLAIVECLLNTGASPSIPDGNGKTPVELARQMSRTDIERCLLDFEEKGNEEIL